MDRATWVRRGTDVAIVATGEMVRHAVDAAALLAEQGVSATVLDMYCVKPLDAEAVVEAARDARAVVTVEEHAPFGGLGSMVAQVVGERCPRPVKCLSLPDAPVITGTSPEVSRSLRAHRRGHRTDDLRVSPKRVTGHLNDFPAVGRAHASPPTAFLRKDDHGPLRHRHRPVHAGHQSAAGG